MLGNLEQDFLKTVNDLIDDRLTINATSDIECEGEQMLIDTCRHLCVSEHAKRARPLLCLYYNLMLSDDITVGLANISVAAEFIHAASLLHDDIVDKAKKRRGKLSANNKYGNDVAVLAGDFLLTESFELLKPYERELSDVAIQVIREMTKSAIVELNTRNKMDVSLAELEKISVGKTGELFSWCGFAVCTLLGRRELIDTFWQVGRKIGIIFQMADDIKDFSGDKDLKDSFKDVLNLEPSIPLSIAVNENILLKNKIKELENKEFSSDDLQQIKLLVLGSNAIDLTKKSMYKHLRDINFMLSNFNGTKGKKMVDCFVSNLFSII